MRLETVERSTQWAGAAALLMFMVAMLQGLWRGWHSPMGRVAGPAPGFVRNYTRGAWWLYGPGTAIGLWLLHLLWRPIRLISSTPARIAVLVLGALLYFPGIALMLWGRLTLGRMYNVSSVLGAQLYSEHRMVTSGPFALVRHPMYVGGALAEVGALLIYRTWAVALIPLQIPELSFRARREEEALAAQFGEQWEEYCRRVPAWIPRLRRGDDRGATASRNE